MSNPEIMLLLPELKTLLLPIMELLALLVTVLLKPLTLIKVEPATLLLIPEMLELEEADSELLIPMMLEAKLPVLRFRPPIEAFEQVRDVAGSQQTLSRTRVDFPVGSFAVLPGDEVHVISDSADTMLAGKVLRVTVPAPYKSHATALRCAVEEVSTGG